MNPVKRFFKRILVRWLVNHYDICASVEQDKAKQCIQNRNHFQKMAALARSELKDLE